MNVTVTIAQLEAIAATGVELPISGDRFTRLAHGLPTDGR